MPVFEKYLIEKNLKNRKVSKVVDEFVRFLIGNRKSAVTNLKKLEDVDIPIPEEKDYNKVYNKLFNVFSNTITTNLDV